MLITILILSTINTLLWCLTSGYHQPEIILQKCLPKADAQNVTIRCAGPDEIIAIHQAFFTSSLLDHCPFIDDNKNQTNENEPNRKRMEQPDKVSCTDDLRLTLNSRCSGQSYCSVNIRKLHYHLCPGFDGWINLKYACLTKNRLSSYCNIQLNENRGYVSNPGYPKFYPPYDCKWTITGYAGQRIQVEILDLQLREPRFVNKKHIPYECIDSVAIVDQGIRVLNLCGETKSNLVDYRSRTNQLTVQFRSYDFSPTRGVLFRYSMIDCPTLKPPSNGYMYRNQSFAIYNCYFDYVFEDSGLPTKTLVCQDESHWNGTVTRCIPKENRTSGSTAAERAYALSHDPSRFDQVDDDRMDELSQSDQPSDDDDGVTVDYIDFEKMTRPFVLLLILGLISLICVIMVLVGIGVHMNRRRSHHDIVNMTFG